MGMGSSWAGQALTPPRSREIASNKRVDSSFVSRMVNLTTLAPDIVTAILDETLPPDLTLFDLAVDPPALWEEQRGRVDWTS